ncbi:uncharacterized protein LOC118326827 isoform X2 [Morone saxatilis]|uniref:uncharacterized protein LOC118326827 isoform X2 n=1 Tax=Morone saxatilis TaxID=34816 RepID=UPI0015E1F65A|nr:uncharacterized protein LOC118326827 isoform X2 [Morone saxatilis]XP_035515828.1 uncharacterized protein LOC118326827 isoform X2 [Morone saxatilis]
MNPFNWEALQRLQRNLDLNHQTVVNSSMHNAPGTDDSWDTYCQHSTYTVDEPQSSMGVHLSEELCHPSQNFYIKEPEVEDPDGEPFEMDEEDPELKRKWIELREIEEKILRKKVAIALKKVEPFGKEATPLGLSCNEQSATCTSASLKDRVNLILQQRHSVSFLSVVRSSKDRMNSSSRSKDVLLQEDHPLKLRVNALRKQRCSNLCVLPTNREVPDISPPLASRSVTSPAKEESSANQGFQRFLSVLNKGVDMDLLSRIVNDDSEDLPLGKELLDVQPPAMENKPDLPFRSESQRSNSGASLLGRSRTNSGERRADPSKRDRHERSLSDHLPDMI